MSSVRTVDVIGRRTSEMMAVISTADVSALWPVVVNAVYILNILGYVDRMLL